MIGIDDADSARTQFQTLELRAKAHLKQKNEHTAPILPDFR
jgi:hypothetical protein